MLNTIQLDSASTTPLYRQLFVKIGEMVRSGALAYGHRLPATRELAGQLGLNRTTVSAAYELLEQDGLIQGHVGRGSFVCFRAPEPIAEGIISFASSRPSADQFPLAEFQACCREVIQSSEAAAILQLGAPAGYAPLRHYLIEQSRGEGSARISDDLVITNGCQQALDLIARVAAPVGSTVIVEDPVYHGLKNVFLRAGARLVGVPVGTNGVDVDHLARTAAVENPRLIVLTPNFQNPTGGTLPLESRRAVLRIARETGAVLVENDLYGELRYEGENLPTLKQLDETGRTVLLRSFSKIAFPGLRVGWVIGPSKLVSELAAARQWCDLHTDQLSQAILWRFAASGQLAGHLERVRAAGREKLKAVLSACERHLPAGSDFTRPQGGMSLWVRLPAAVDTAAALIRAEREGVTYLPGRHFGISNIEPSSLRLSFGGLTVEQIEAGVAILGRVLREETNRAGHFEALDTAMAQV